MKAPQRPLFSLNGRLACPECGVRDDWRVVDRPQVRQNSLTAKATCGHCGKHVFVKRVRGASDREAVALAARQFEACRVLAGTPGFNGTLGVSRPLAHLGDVLVLEFVDGERGDLVLSRVDRHSQLALLRQMGEWFGRFHGTSKAVEGYADLVSKLHGLRQHIGPLTCEEPMAARTLRYLEMQLPSFADRIYQCVLIHGDAKPANFLVSGAAVVGIDVDTPFNRPPENDVAQFLAQCAIELSSFGHRFDDDHQDRLDAAFLEGYNRFRPLEPNAINWLRGYFLLSFWRSKSGQGMLRRLRWSGFFRHRLKRYLLRALANPGPPGLR